MTGQQQAESVVEGLRGCLCEEATAQALWDYVWPFVWHRIGQRCCTLCNRIWTYHSFGWA